MGSKTRRLRVAAGVAGHAHQADVRRAARAAARAAGSAGNRLETRGPHVLTTYTGSAASAIAQAGPAFAPPWAVERARLAATRRAELRALLAVLAEGVESEPLADAIDVRARVQALESVHPNFAVIDDVWESALAELRRGVAPSDLSVLRLDRSDVEAMKAAMPRADEVRGEPFEPEAAPAPREPGMRRVNRAVVPMALATLLAMASLGAADDPKEER